MRYINLAIFIVLFFVYLGFFSHVTYSTNFLEIFFSQKSLKLFNIAKKMGSGDEVLVSKKGFDKKNLDELYNIAIELKKIPEVQEVSLSNSLSPELKEYIKKHYYLLADFKAKQTSLKQIYQKLQEIYQKLYNSILFEPVNMHDPFEFFTFGTQQEKNFFKLKDFGYVLKVKTNIDTSNANISKQFYDKLNETLEKHENTIATAPFFYLVENSNYIKNDAQKIMFLATLLLLILYFFILKNIKLFINSIIAIGSSVLSAIMVTSLFYESINVLSLAFGVSITTISIDYMFHYYFYGNFSPNRNVFFGFLTTIGVFTIFSFINIEFFSQLAIFGAISISVAYLLFSFAFVHLNIKKPSITIKKQIKKGFHPLYVVVFSFILLIISFQNLEFDYELKNLDYQNKKLINISKKFNKGFNQEKFQKVLIEGETKEKLLENYEKLLISYPTMIGIGKFVLSQKKCEQKLIKLKQYDFSNLKENIMDVAKEVGFKKGFEEAYLGVDKQKCDMSVIDAMKFKIIKQDNHFYTLALVNQKEVIKNSSFAHVVDVGEILKHDTREMKNRLIVYMYISLAFILLVLLYISKQYFYYPLMYLMFPISTVLFVLSLFSKINIMHIFALVILLAVSIDYGIYLHNTKSATETKIAIKYALLSTFCGFGALVFSSTVALFSIGIVITIGISAIFLLLYVSL